MAAPTGRALLVREPAPVLLHEVAQRGLLQLEIAVNTIESREVRLQRAGLDGAASAHVSGEPTQHGVRRGRQRARPIRLHLAPLGEPDKVTGVTLDRPRRQRCAQHFSEPRGLGNVAKVARDERLDLLAPRQALLQPSTLGVARSGTH